jgi:CIC family chloride channel protein
MTPIRTLADQAREIDLHSVGRALFLSSLVGVVAGSGAIVFQVLCQAGQHFFLDLVAGVRTVGPAGEPLLFSPTQSPFRPWMIPVVAGFGGLLTGLIVTRFAPEAAGHGTDEAVDAFHRRRGVIRGRVPIVKTIASAITMGSGGSGGREGPIAQIGAGFGSFLATRLGLSEKDRRVLLASGVGAGVGSIFRAPLAGALFAAEVLYSDSEFESEVIIPAAIASIIAYCVFSVKFGFGALFDTPRFSFHSAYELFPYTVLALIVALGAGIFVKTFYGMHRLFERSPLPRFLRPAIGGLATGSLAVILYYATRDARSLDVLAFGYGSIQSALHGQLPLLILACLAGGKILATSFSIGSGGSGGVFGPSMVIGGTLGGAIGLLAQRVMPTIVTQPAAFVPVGMAGFFAAAANTPISTLVMVSEMTGNYQLLLPALWVCALSYLVGRRWTLYRSQVPSRADSPAHRGAILTSLLKGLRVGDLLTPRNVQTVLETAPAAAVIEAFMNSAQYCLPVVDAEGRLTGWISLPRIRQVFEDREGPQPLIAHDLIMPGPPLTLNETLNDALARMSDLDEIELPVIENGDGRKIAGLLSRRDILRAYTRRAETSTDTPEGTT